MRGGIRIISFAACAVALGSGGCAAVFRDAKIPVRVESNPSGGELKIQDQAVTTPAEVKIPRSGITEIRVNMAGFEEHHGTVRKNMNGLWLTADLATCVVPVLLCVPLFVDALTGAWYDIEPIYRANLAPLGLASTPYPSDYLGVPRVAKTAAPPPTTTGAASSTISESERKASARAAYQEGIELQTKSNYPEALGRFQYAQRVYDAPTHLLHIAQCHAHTGKLVEAQESYETLTHRELPPDAPAPFREAVEIGHRELAELRPRIPTLRVEVAPAPSTLRNLVVQLNGRPIPNDVLAIARPVNPGTYRIGATAWGISPSKTLEVTLEEGSAKTISLTLGH